MAEGHDSIQKGSCIVHLLYHLLSCLLPCHLPLIIPPPFRFLTNEDLLTSFADEFRWA